MLRMMRVFPVVDVLIKMGSYRGINVSSSEMFFGVPEPRLSRPREKGVLG
jgi:hypothetical protein